MSTIQRPKVLAVEGDTDSAYIRALMDEKGIDDIWVQTIGSDDIEDYLVGDYIDGLVSSSSFRYLDSIGIVVDADDNPKGTFESVCHHLSQCGLPHPQQPGEIIDGDKRVGVFVLPDNESEGMLETLILETLSGTQVYTCIEEYVQCCRAAGLSLDTEPKAKVRAFLSVQNPLAKDIMKATIHDHFPFDQPECEPLTEFLRVL